MSETANIKLFKHDNPSTNKNLFDVTKSLNENWDKIDKYVTDQETSREENENIRQEQEETRQSKEDERQSQEETRQSNENIRQSQEETRQSNETIRNEAETQREEYITELKERVENGEFKGDPNILTIGNVSGGEEASAEIVGDSPNQKLNLVLPKGDKGNVGDKGETGNGIANIEDTEVTHKSGTIDKYTINYTDGTTKEIQVYNGKDGEGSGDIQKLINENKANIEKNTQNINTNTQEITTLKNNSLKYKTITIPQQSWVEKRETETYEYDVKDESITENHLLMGHPDTENQEKMSGTGDIKSYNGGYKVIVKELPEGDVTMGISIQKAEVI